MADPQVTGGGGEAFGYLVTRHLPECIELLVRIEHMGRVAGLDVLQESATRLLTEMMRDVNVLAAQMAGVADGTIIRKIIETESRNRPQQSQMLMHIRSEPGPFGSVRVGLMSELEKIVNPIGEYGPYWRAQEFGTGQDGVPSQLGRALFGTFEPSGTPPLGEQRGRGVGTDLAFVPRGANPGEGRISVDLPGRHFLRDGTAEAGARYIKAIDDLQGKWADQIDALVSTVRGALRGGTVFRGVIKD